MLRSVENMALSKLEVKRSDSESHLALQGVEHTVFDTLSRLDSNDPDLLQ